MRAYSDIAADRFDDAVPGLQQARHHYELNGAVPWISQCHRALANTYFLMGQWDDALAEVQTAWLLAEETGIHGLRSYQGDPAPLIHLHRGELREAERDLLLIDQALSVNRPPVADLWYLPLQGLVAEARGDGEAALQAFEQVCRLAEEIGMLPDYRSFGQSMVRLAMAAGRRDLAERAVAGAARLAEQAQGLPSADGVALLCRGLLEDDPAALCAAVEAYRRSPRPGDLARACEAAGALLVRHERRAQGVALLEEAQQVCERLGAARDSARITYQLRQLGIRRGAQARHARSRVGWESLTPTELKIVGLLAAGLSNPAIGEQLYISRRTVQTHVSSIFSKLDVASRAELAALAARRLVSVEVPRR